MRRTDFTYQLPEELKAQQPLAERSASRLLTLDGGSGALADRQMRDLPELIAPGDLLVFNDTRVIPARLFAVKESGGKVELLLERPLDSHKALVHARASKPLRPAMRNIVGPSAARRIGGDPGSDTSIGLCMR